MLLSYLYYSLFQKINLTKLLMVQQGLEIQDPKTHTWFWAKSLEDARFLTKSLEDTRFLVLMH